MSNVLSFLPSTNKLRISASILAPVKMIEIVWSYWVTMQHVFLCQYLTKCDRKVENYQWKHYTRRSRQIRSLSLHRLKMSFIIKTAASGSNSLERSQKEADHQRHNAMGFGPYLTKKMNRNNQWPNLRTIQLKILL